MVDGEDFAVHDGVVVEGALADSIVAGGPPDEVAGADGSLIFGGECRGGGRLDLTPRTQGDALG
jgi:hypothetical protein